MRVYQAGHILLKPTRVLVAFLIFGMIGLLGACSDETPTSAPTTVMIQSGAAPQITAVPLVTGASSGLSAPKPAATATPLPATPTALASVAPNGTLALVQDGKLLLVKPDGSDTKEITDLGSDLSDKFSLRWSPDGNRFLLNEANRKLSLIELDGKRTTLLEVNPATETIGTISWSSANKYLAFERIPNGDRGRETHGEIWVADLSDPAAPTLNNIANGFSPAFSPDGRNIAFATYGRDVNQEGLVFNNAINLTSVDGKQSRQVLDVDQLPEYRNPADSQNFDMRPSLFTALGWSPDGRNLTFHDGRNYVGTVATTGGRVRVWWFNTAREAGKISSIVWSSRNDRLAFNFLPTADPTKPRLILTDAQKPAAVPPGDNFACQTWSPDGSLLAAANGKDLTIVRATDQQIYGSVKTTGCPVWSPDGAWLAVSQDSGPEVTKGLRLLRPDGSDFHPALPLNATRQLKIVGWKR